MSRPRFDPSITQRVRVALMEDGHVDLIIEAFTSGMNELEDSIGELRRDVLLLQQSDRDRLTQTGMWTFIEAKLGADAIDWGTWALRGGLAAAGTLALAGIAHHVLK